MLIVVGALVVVGVLVVAVTVVALRLGDDEVCGADGGVGCDPPVASTGTDEPADPGDRWGVASGPADAEHEVVVYEDLLCPPCAEFSALASAELRERAEAGEIRLVVRPVAFLTEDDYTEQAANAVLVVRDEAGDDVALELNEQLLEEQPPESGPFPNLEDLVDAAVEAGADEDAVREGIEQTARADLLDRATRRAIEREDVEAVPLVLLDGEPFEEGAQPDRLAPRLLAELG